jgi:phosphohistidine phosphatase SixA
MTRPARSCHRGARAGALAIVLLLVAASGTARADDAAAWAALRQGGAVALMRHGDAPGVGDPPGWRLDDCATQRTLGERGRAEARAVGARLRAERIAIDRVVSSPWCRCIETARLVDAGPVHVEPAFANAFVLRERREALRDAGRTFVAAWRGPGTLLVVTHGENIAALTGRAPATAEIVVVAPGAGGALREIGVVTAPAPR